MSSLKDSKKLCESTKLLAADGSFNARNRPSSSRTYASICILCAASFLCYLNFALLAPIFPPTALKRGVSPVAIGLVIGIYNLVIFLSSFVFGAIIHNVGQKFMFITGTTVSAVCGMLFGLLDFGPSGGVYITMCFVTRCAQAVGSSAFQTAVFTIIGSQFAHKMSFFFSLVSTCASLGTMLAPAVAGGFYEVGGYICPFVFAAGVLLLLSFASCFVLNFNTVTASKSKTKTTSSSWKLCFNPGAMALIFSLYTCSSSFSFMEPTLAVFLKAFDLKTFQVGLMFLIVSGTFACFSVITGYITQNRGNLLSVILSGSVISCVGYMFLAPAPFLNVDASLWLFSVASVLYGFGAALVYVPIFSALVITALNSGYADTVETNGMISGLLTAAYALGCFVGASYSGVLVNALNFRNAVFLISMTFLINAFVLSIYGLVKRKSNGRGEVFTKRISTTESISHDKNIKYEQI